MGRFKCKKHGLQPFFEVCEHIYDDFDKQVIDDVYEMTFNILICKGCKNRIKAEELDNWTFKKILEVSEEEALKYEVIFTKKYDLLVRKAICMTCAEEVQFYKKIGLSSWTKRILHFLKKS